MSKKEFHFSLTIITQTFGETSHSFVCSLTSEINTLLAWNDIWCSITGMKWLMQKRCIFYHLTLECPRFFFAVFWNIPLKTKKNDIQKNEHFPASIKTSIKKCQYTLRKKNHIFEKSPLPAILCDFTLLTIIEHAFSIFYQKNW